MCEHGKKPPIPSLLAGSLAVCGNGTLIGAKNREKKLGERGKREKILREKEMNFLSR